MKKILFIAAFCIPFVMQTHAQTTAPATPESAKPKVYTGPKGCPNAMKDAEFETVRNTVESENDMDNVIVVAKKEAIKNCFSADQAKEIMKLLKTDDNKFEFFKAVYPHIYDQNNYVKVNATYQDKSYSEKARLYINSLE